jgi:3-dehydroquinate synthase II
MVKPMRELWVKVDSSLSEKEKKALIKGASEFCTTFIVEDAADVELARKSGAKKVASHKGGDIVLIEKLSEAQSAKEGKKAACIVTTVTSKEDEEKIVKAAEASIEYIAIKCLNWKIIPLENLIAKAHGKSKLLAWISNAQEAKLALEVLEIGVDGVVAELSDLAEIERINQEMKKVKTREEEKEAAEKITLVPARVVELKPLGSGARVCVDTCDLMKIGEGMLVGCQSSGLFLIQAEVYESPFVNPRPFRVNAGSAALYTLVPGGKTKYLSELQAGDEVLIVDREGRNRVTNVARVKIEQRPLMLIEAEYEGKRIKTIVQNAETIRVVTKDGHKSIAELKSGDEVMAHIEEGGRHFGTLVKEEMVIER